MQKYPAHNLSSPALSDLIRTCVICQVNWFLYNFIWCLTFKISAWRFLICCFFYAGVCCTGRKLLSISDVRDKSSFFQPTSRTVAFSLRFKNSGHMIKLQMKFNARKFNVSRKSGIT